MSQWGRVQNDWCPSKGIGNLDKETCIEGRQCREMRGEDGHLQAKERGWEQSLPSAVKRSRPVSTLNSDFQAPELWDNTFLLFNPSVVLCHDILGDKYCH